jgi:hypothetical protein
MAESTNLRCCKNSFSFYLVSLESGSTCTDELQQHRVSVFGFQLSMMKFLNDSIAL